MGLYRSASEGKHPSRVAAWQGSGGGALLDASLAIVDQDGVQDCLVLEQALTNLVTGECHGGVQSDKKDLAHHLVAAPLRFEVNIRWRKGCICEGDLAIVYHPGPDIGLDLFRFLELLEEGLDIGQRLGGDDVA